MAADAITLTKMLLPQYALILPPMPLRLYVYATPPQVRDDE